MNKHLLSQYNLDITKSISNGANIKFYLSFYKESHLDYYHSEEETNNYYGNLIIYNENTFKIVNQYSFSISKDNWDFYYKNGVSEIQLLYDKVNEVILIIRDNLTKTKKIIEIIYYKNFLVESDSEKILTEYRLCDDYFSNNGIKLDSIIGTITLHYENSKSKKTFIIYNISDEDFYDSVSGWPDDLVVDEEKEYKLWENEKAEVEIKKLKNSVGNYLPYYFFTPKEWRLIELNYPSKYFKSSLLKVFTNIVSNKYQTSKQPSQQDKDAIIQELNRIFIESKQNYYERDEKFTSSDWLKDAAGTDDLETMNDVYWNLD